MYNDSTRDYILCILTTMLLLLLNFYHISFLKLEQSTKPSLCLNCQNYWGCPFLGNLIVEIWPRKEISLAPFLDKALRHGDLKKTCWRKSDYQPPELLLYSELFRHNYIGTSIKRLFFPASGRANNSLVLLLQVIQFYPEVVTSIHIFKCSLDSASVNPCSVYPVNG